MENVRFLYNAGVQDDEMVSQFQLKSQKILYWDLNNWALAQSPPFFTDSWGANYLKVTKLATLIGMKPDGTEIGDTNKEKESLSRVTRMSTHISNLLS
jgi:hypothetical protein